VISSASSAARPSSGPPGTGTGSGSSRGPAAAPAIELARQLGTLPESEQQRIAAAGPPYRLRSSTQSAASGRAVRRISASTPEQAAKSIRALFSPEELAELIRLLTSPQD